MQCLPERKLFLEEGLLASIICGLILLPELRMVFTMVLRVSVCAKGRLGVLGVDRVPSIRSYLLFADKVHAEKALTEKTAALLEVLC